MNDILLEKTIEAMKEWRDRYSSTVNRVLKPAKSSPYDECYDEYTENNFDDSNASLLIDFIIYAFMLDKLNNQKTLSIILEQTFLKLFADARMQAKFVDKLKLMSNLKNELDKIK